MLIKWNNKIKQSTSIIFYIMFAFLIQACGGSSNASSPPVNTNNQSSSSSSISAAPSSSSSSSNIPLSLNLPETLKWQENQDFSYYIPSEGTAPIEYTLLTSPDAHLFLLDVSTGNLTLSAVFDYERPLDVDLNNTYELSMQVSNASGVVIQGNLLINIENIVEYQGVIDFPIDGSNVGGFDEATIHVRGHILFEGQRIINLPSTLAISVNDQFAVFLDDGTGSWSIEVPLKKGMNPLDVRVKENENIVYEGGISLKNIPVSDKRTEVYYGDTSIYSIAVGGHAIVKSSTVNVQIEEVLNISDIASVSDCTLFKRILFSNSNARLIIECDHTLLIYNILEKTTKVLLDDLVRYSGRRFFREYLWIDDNHLLYNITDKSFRLINIFNNTLKEFKIDFNGEELFFVPFYFINEDLFYVLTTKKNSEVVWTTFNINEIINENNSVGIITTIESNINMPKDLPQDVISRNGVVYVLQNDKQLIEIDLQANTKREIDFSLTTNENDVADFDTDISRSLSFMFSDDNHLILRNGYKGHFFSLNTNTGSIKIIKSLSHPKFLLRNDKFFKSAENINLISYANSSRKFSKINITTFELIEVDNLLGKLLSNYYSRGGISFDWDNEVLYRAPKEVGGSSYKILAYDFKFEKEKIILNENEIYDYLGYENIGINILDISFNKNTNSLWFSALTTFPSFGGINGVYSLNMETKVINTLYETTFTRDGLHIGTPFLSDFYSSINGVVLTGGGGFSGARGFINLLDMNGYLTKITPAIAHINNGFSIINESRHLLYYAGFRTEGDYHIPNAETMEIYEYNLTADTHRKIATNSEGIGFDINFVSGRFELDSDRQNLLGVLAGRMFILDTYSGDRVLKGLTLQ